MAALYFLYDMVLLRPGVLAAFLHPFNLKLNRLSTQYKDSSPF